MSLETVKLDGRMGEGGGQIVRIAVALAALSGTPLEISNIRGNRATRGGGGGLKAQHLTCVNYLAAAADAQTLGCFVRSESISFLSSPGLSCRTDFSTEIKADSAASIQLVFQAVLPFLIFTGSEQRASFRLRIRGGTNVSFSMSIDFTQQVLLPVLKTFGINVNAKILQRGWAHGRSTIGCVEFEIQPLQPGQKLAIPPWPKAQGNITSLGFTVIVPSTLISAMKSAIKIDTDAVFKGIPFSFHHVEESLHPSHIYLLLVAHTSTGLKFAQDCLYARKLKGKTNEAICKDVVREVVGGLKSQLKGGRLVDVHLQDQLVIFQALAEGKSCIRAFEKGREKELRLEKDMERLSLEEETQDQYQLEESEQRGVHVAGPFGDGSLHTVTARWVVKSILPGAKWHEGGAVCEGVGWSSQSVVE